MKPRAWVTMHFSGGPQDGATRTVPPRALQQWDGERVRWFIAGPLDTPERDPAVYLYESRRNYHPGRHHVLLDYVGPLEEPDQ